MWKCCSSRQYVAVIKGVWITKDMVVSLVVGMKSFIEDIHFEGLVEFWQIGMEER